MSFLKLKGIHKISVHISLPHFLLFFRLHSLIFNKLKSTFREFPNLPHFYFLLGFFGSSLPICAGPSHSEERISREQPKDLKGSWNMTQRDRICLACIKSWIQYPATQKEKKCQGVRVLGWKTTWTFAANYIEESKSRSQQTFKVVALEK
jgi:hypothetical protein